MNQADAASVKVHDPQNAAASFEVFKATSGPWAKASCLGSRTIYDERHQKVFVHAHPTPHCSAWQRHSDNTV